MGIPIHSPCIKGDPGDSAYQVAVNNGFTGTMPEWLLSLKGSDGTAQGLPGPKGDEGDIGPQGPQGERGYPGEAGIQGERGLQGLPGNDGATGAPGVKGDQGIQGLTGNDGLPGTQGIKGDQGIQGIQGIPGIGGMGYIINVQALTSSPVDSATIYFGMLPKAPVTSANISKIYIRKAGTIKIAEIYCYSGTAGTSEAWSLYIRKNNTTDTLIKTLNVATSERIFTNEALSIPVVAGDYIEIKGVQPLWATNPLTTIYGGYIYIE
jgi:hypothetical protein